MSKKEFDNFIKKQEVALETKEPVDWKKIKEDWLSNVDAFYKMISGFLKEYIDTGKIKMKYTDHFIHEERLGRYKTQRLTLDISGQKVEFTPIGTNLIGAHGRIDMEGKAGKVKFILTEKNSKGINIQIYIATGKESKVQNHEHEEVLKLAWKISTPPPRITFIDINNETFFDALMEVLNG